MKKELYIASLIGLSVGVLITSGIFLFKSSFSKGKDSISIALPQTNSLSDNYLAKIETFGLLFTDFQNAYDQVVQNMPAEQLAVAQQNEALFKSEILETLINQYVVVATAIQEGFLEDQENLLKFKTVAQQALFQLYVSENLPIDSSLQVSQPQIDQAYAQYGGELRARGMNAQQSKEFLVAQLSQQNRQRWVVEFIGKLKEGFRIERNKNLMERENIGMLGMGMSS